MATCPIADDPAKLSSLIDSMATYLDLALRWNNPEDGRDDLHWKRDAGLIAAEKRHAQTLASTLYNEARYMPNTEQLDYLEELKITTDQAERAEKLATELLKVCDDTEGTGEEEEDMNGVSDTGAVALAPYASWWAYYHYRVVDEACELVVGGLGRMLKDRIELLARSWLHECDRVLCLVHDSHPANDHEIDTMSRQLAKEIAKRVTLHNSASPFAEADKLEPSSLGARNEVEFTRVRIDAQCQARNDMRALEALKVLAREPMSAQAMSIFKMQLPLLQMVVERPPKELGLVGENARRMNLSMLARCLIPGMDTACRMHIAGGWASRHGAWAQTAIAEAIRRLEGFSAREKSHFIQVATHVRGSTLMPAMPWAPWAQPWFAIPPPSGPANRTGLDEEGARVVRLGSFVWQLVGEGAFEQGVMSASVVSGVSFECLQLARLGRELVDHERMCSNTGVTLLNFSESLDNLASSLAPELDKAQCCLSHFSLKDINDVFHPEKPLLERVYVDLTQRTRGRLGNGRTPIVPIAYRTFVGDALALLLPAIESRRMMIGLPHVASAHPLGDMLRTVDKCRQWTPLQGKCRLDVADFRLAHPKLREELERYVKLDNSFVSASHMSCREIASCEEDGCKGEERTVRKLWYKTKAKVSFEFDSTPLLQLLKM
tara:strand:- start:6362 stop:8347 length:1986 start_codon:yes stop_codon:yes gene_type:complete